MDDHSLEAEEMRVFQKSIDSLTSSVVKYSSTRFQEIRGQMQMSREYKAHIQDSFDAFKVLGILKKREGYENEFSNKDNCIISKDGTAINFEDIAKKF